MNTFPGRARHLSLDPSGLWVAKSQSELSYPDEGNHLCFALEENSFWFRHRNRVIVNALRLYPPQGVLFDIGGGNGYVAMGLENAGFPTVLVEPGRAGAENACRRGLRNVVCATTDDAGFEAASMDAVGLFDVLEHMPDDVAFLGSLKRLMRPGGRIYVTVPAFRMLWSKEDEFAGHYRRYTRRSLGLALETAGFTIEYLTYFFWFLPVPVFLSRSLPSRLGLRGTPSPQSWGREHSGGGLSGRVVDWLLARELNCFRRGGSLPLGGSCLAVAKSSD